MFTYQLKTVVADKIDAMLKSGKTIGHLRSGDDIQFFLISAITHVQTGRKRMVDFDKHEFHQMIAYNKQEIERATDAGDKVVLTALNEVLSEIANPKKQKHKDKPAVAGEKDDEADTIGAASDAPEPSDDEQDTPKKSSSKRGIPKGPVPVSVVDEANLSPAEKQMWSAWKTLNAALPTEGGCIEHYTRLSFHSSLKRNPEELYNACNKLMDAIAASGRAGELYNLLYSMQDAHIDVLREAMKNKANDNVKEHSGDKPVAQGGRSR